MSNEEYGETSNIIYDGIKRAELAFGKHSITHNLYRNIKRINDSDATEGALYQKWLFENKIPTLKQEIEDAIVDSYMKTGDMEGLWECVDKFQANLEKFKTLCRKEFNELEFLKSYI